MEDINKEEKGLVDKRMEIATIIIVVCAIFIVFAMYNPKTDDLKEQMVCYEKIMNDSAFLPLKELKDANKTFIYCTRDWQLNCYCKFYFGSGIVIYRDVALTGDMPYFLEKKNG